MKEFVISTTKKETAILVGLITATLNERWPAGKPDGCAVEHANKQAAAAAF